MWAKHGRPIHALVNNAGIFDMGTPVRTVTKEGFESHCATNHLGPFLLTMLLLPFIQVRITARRTAHCTSHASQWYTPVDNSSA